MDQTLRSGALFVLVTFGALAYRPKIDQFSHSVFPEAQRSDLTARDSVSNESARPS
jgi:hypothetical protein